MAFLKEKHHFQMIHVTHGMRRNVLLWESIIHKSIFAHFYANVLHVELYVIGLRTL
mgnify:CR=1 FL=1